MSKFNYGLWRRIYGFSAGWKMPSTTSIQSVHGHSPPKPPFLIGVAGGTASGKTTVCNKIMERLGLEHQRQVALLSADSFYRSLSEEERSLAFRGQFNFDHPDAINWEMMREVLNRLQTGRSVQIPTYDFRTHTEKLDEILTISPVDVVLCEGILIFYNQEIREVFNMKLFVDTDPDTRLARRVVRDTRERDRDLEQVLHQYINLVKPAFEEFCLPTKKYADVIIPRGGDNDVAIDLIVQHIQDLLLSRSPRATPSDTPMVTPAAGGPLVVDGRSELLNRRKRSVSESGETLNVFRPH